MNESAKERWKRVLLRLQETEDSIAETKKVLTQEVCSLRILQELVKEQAPDEDTCFPARALR